MKLFRLFFIVLLFSFVSLAYGQFRFENPIWIKNNTAVALTNVQVLLRLNTQIPIALGRMDTTGKDIRFTGACGDTTFLNHWLEAYLNTDSTKIWVKVPAIGASDSTLIFLYYGNPTALNVSTLNVFDGPNSSTDSVVVASQNNPNYGNQRGFRFTSNLDVLVGYLGKRVPNATQRYVTLFDFTTQAILAQVQVPAGTAGVYNYIQLTTPIWLKSGSQYVLEVFQTGAADYYYYGVSTQIGQAFTLIEMRYCNNCTQNTFPTTTLTGQHYGIPDLLYYTKQNISPAPTYRVVRGGDTVTPAAPLNLTALCSPGQAVLTWNKSPEFDVGLYQIFRDTTNNPATATLIGTKIDPDTTYTATGLTNGIMYYFWVKAVDVYCNPRISAFSTMASCTPINVNPIGIGVPDKYYLDQNYPDPFNPTTTIKYGLKKAGDVEISVYDALGRLIKTLVKENQQAGYYKIIFDAQGLSSGIYFYKIVSGQFSDIKKMVFIK